MVKSCCAWGCTNRQQTGSGLGFYRIPTDLLRRERWIQAIRREGWTPSPTDRLCGAHFITGKANAVDKDHPDFVPTIFKFNENSSATSEMALQRFERSTSVRKRRESFVTSVDHDQVSESVDSGDDDDDNDDDNNIGTQTDGEKDLLQHNTQLMDEVTSLREERDRLREENRNARFGAQKLETDDRKTAFFTGLHSYALFECLFRYVSAKMETGPVETKLQLKDELLLVLMKLRLNLCFEDLADRFNIAKGTASKIFHKWLPILYSRLQLLIRWPDRETTLRTLPSAFQKHFRKVRCVIDCSEIFIERPTSFKARSQTYSNYKKHNTVKILIGVTPNGVISFISTCYGGRISDKEITKRSGFYDKLEHGDIVLADRGFLIGDELALRGCELMIPSFTRGKNQLTQKDVEMSRRLSRVRIHIERVIGLLKNKYTILQGILPISLVKRDVDTEYATVDKIVTICAALTNLSAPVV